MSQRILVADDEELERRALRRILGEAPGPGYEVVEARNGIEALEAARAGPLALAFLDIRMPGRDGIETARCLRELRPDLPIVFLTAHDRFEYAREALRIHVEDFLLKPASAEEVLAAVDKALGAEARNPEAGGRLESAAAWLAEELRAGLARGRLDGEGYRRWLALKGLGPAPTAVLAFRRRAATEERPALGSMGLGAFASLAERNLGGSALAGADFEEGACVHLLAAGDSGEKEREAVDRLLEEARGQLGLELLAGLAFCPEGEGVEDGTGSAFEILLGAARRAAALAGGGRGLIALQPSLRAKDQGFLKGARAEGPGGRTAYRALELMDELHAEDLSLDALAALVGVSPSHLSRLLGRHFGLGFAECLARLRIDNARILLGDEALSVKEVAALVGFHDPAYFSRVFRKATGRSPNEHRRLARGGGETGAPSGEEVGS